MTFASDQAITAADYNTLVDDLNAIYGTGNGDSGYGGNSASVVSTATDLPHITASSIIENEDWLDLRNAMADCADHQGTTLSNDLPLLTNLEDGDSVGFATDSAPLFASLNGTPPNNVTELTTNRLNSVSNNFTLSTKLSSVRTTAWGSSPSIITHEFTVTFTDSDHARYFFNTGGQLSFSASRANGTVSSQNTEWTNMLSLNSPLTFSAADYYALTASFVANTTVYASSLTTYNNPVAIEGEKNKWIINARRDDAAGANGGNGSILRFQSQFIDGFTGPTQDALGTPGFPVGGLADGVDGTFSSSINQKISTEIFNIASPTYATITELSV